MAEEAEKEAEVLHLMLQLSLLLVSGFGSCAGVSSDAVLGHDGIGEFAASWCWLWLCCGRGCKC